MMTEQTPIACSLTADDYRGRLETIRRVGREAFLGMTEIADGIGLRFRNSSQTSSDLLTIVDAEASCCPFLSIRVDEAGNELMVTVTAPPEAAPVVADLVRSFRGIEVVT
jgi:MerR family copper efflux transcriptional regulator